MRFSRLLFVPATALLLASLSASALPGASAQESATVTMGPGREASQPGTAILTAQGNQTQVVLNIQPGLPGAQQPAHIHQGTCPDVGAVAVPLSNVVDGRSTTIIDRPLSSLLGAGLSINVHKGTSPADLNVYVSCGNIPASIVTSPTPTATLAETPKLTPSLAAIEAPKGGGFPLSGHAGSPWYPALLTAGGITAGLGIVLLARSLRPLAVTPTVASPRASVRQPTRSSMRPALMALALLAAAFFALRPRKP